MFIVYFYFLQTTQVKHTQSEKFRINHAVISYNCVISATIFFQQHFSYFSILLLFGI